MSAKDRKSRLGQQLVYLHCQTLFVGEYTRLRSLKSIKEFLVQRKHAIPVLFDDYPLDKVCSIAQKLLIDGIFESETRAQGRFPLLLDPSRLKPSQEASSNTRGSQVQTSDLKPVLAGMGNIVEPQESRDKGSQIETSDLEPGLGGGQNDDISPEPSHKPTEQVGPSNPPLRQTCESNTNG